MRITVLAGGPSAEREVSLMSGQAIAEGLRRRGHDVYLADIGPDNLGALERPADVVFSALHGTWGEDGQLQALLEKRGICFVGSGSHASATAMDKVATKQIVREMGIPTPDWQVVVGNEALSIDPPLVAKPVDQGSSVATTIVRSAAEATDALQRVLKPYGRALVERCIEGDELTVGILAGDPLPPIVIRPKGGFYDYDAKYFDDATEYLFDAGHAPAVYARARELSRGIFERLGCRHLARIDWMVDRAGELWFLEVNTLPGFTSHSLVPKAGAHIGISFDELCEKLARMALEDRR
jgi:D-alanine-D-alanine ligase